MRFAWIAAERAEFTVQLFTNYDGSVSTSYYKEPIRTLFTAAGLLTGSAGTPRSAYSFRHTYATFRLMEGVDVYFLAKQMGTSVKMIEDYYGHITPSTSTEQILQGMQGWSPALGNPPPARGRRSPGDGSSKPRPPGQSARRKRKRRTDPRKNR